MKTKNLELYISLITPRLTIKVKLLNRNALLKNFKQYIKKNKIKKTPDYALLSHLRSRSIK